MVKLVAQRAAVGSKESQTGKPGGLTPERLPAPPPNPGLDRHWSAPAPPPTLRLWLLVLPSPTRAPYLGGMESTVQGHRGLPPRQPVTVLGAGQGSQTWSHLVAP